MEVGVKMGMKGGGGGGEEVGSKEKEKMGYEETELRLGLPGDGEVVRKRDFSHTVDLKLNLISTSPTGDKDKNLLPSHLDPAKPPPAKYVLPFSANDIILFGFCFVFSWEICLTAYL